MYKYILILLGVSFLWSCATTTNINTNGEEKDIVFELSILKDGTVGYVKVVSTDIEDEDFIEKMKNKIKTFIFKGNRKENLIVTFPVKIIGSKESIEEKLKL